jgi:hypothetical protein
MARESRSVWQRRVERWTRSGLSGAEFASRVGVKEATLRHWKWQLARGVLNSAPAAEFIEVPPALTTSLVSAGVFELALADGRQLRIPAAFDAASLRRLLAVLTEA